MADTGILARSEIRVMIKNSYLNTHANTTGSSADIDLVTLTPHSAFEYLKSARSRGIPMNGVNSSFDGRGLTINGAVLDTDPNGVDRTAGSGFINGKEKNDPYFLEERHACAVMHPNGYRWIRPNGTTARGIIIHG